MKVLVMYVDEFSYTPAQKNLEEADDVKEGASLHRFNSGIYTGRGN
jgi:hypothetical protein